MDFILNQQDVKNWRGSLQLNSKAGLELIRKEKDPKTELLQLFRSLKIQHLISFCRPEQYLSGHCQPSM